MGRFGQKPCQTTEFSRPKRLLLCKWESKSVANFSRENGHSSKWGFGAEMLAQKTKMGSHFLASILYCKKPLELGSQVRDRIFRVDSEAGYLGLSTHQGE